MKLNSEEIIKVLDSLIGSIVPVADENADRDAMINLQCMEDVIDEYIYRINDISQMECCGYESKKKVIDKAKNFIEYLGSIK